MTDLFEPEQPSESAPPSSRRARRAQEARAEAARQAKARKAKRRVRSAIVLVVALALVAGAVWLVLPTVKSFFEDEAEDYAGPGTGTVLIEIPSGSSGRAIADLLADADVVASPEAFVDAYGENPNATSIQAGFYNLKLQMAAEDAVLALLDSANRAELSITVPEGWRAAYIYERISSVTGVPLTDVEAAAADTASYGLPAEANGNPEGWLAASTYTFPPNVTVPEILSAMVDTTEQWLEGEGLERERWQEVLIIASITQREGLVQDFDKVARVIINRLDTSNPETVGMIGMDSVLLYGLGLDSVLLTNEQKDADTPYNVFRNQGLPPTPIASPSIEAIRAAINPAEGNWHFFVTVNLTTGETKFAETYDEFQVYVAEYQQWLRDNPEANPNVTHEP